MITGGTPISGNLHLGTGCKPSGKHTKSYGIQHLSYFHKSTISISATASWLPVRYFYSHYQRITVPNCFSTMAVSAIAGKFQKTTGMGPPVDSVQLPYKWLNSMVYGRYNELVNGGYFMVYKPTFTSQRGAPSFWDGIRKTMLCRWKIHEVQ